MDPATDRIMTVTDVQKMFEHLNRAGLVNAVAGYTDVWVPAMAGIKLSEAHEAFAHFRDNGPPGNNLFIRPHDIRKRVLSRRQQIPHHLQCPNHPGVYEYNCPHCRLQIEAPNPKSVEAAKQEARKAAEAARQKREAAIEAWHAARETEYLKFINPKDRPDQSS